jgi:predicted acylesterase/phospholipase RssA
VAPDGRDVAVVLSGGGINGVLLELGFLKRLRESELWPRIGWMYGTSAGALVGALGALDRLDDLETFLLDLRPEDAFRQRRMWQMAGGLHDYTLPETIADRLGDPDELGHALASSEIELVAIATDVSGYEDVDDGRTFELAYASRSTPQATMGRAILASAAVSGLVLPLTVDGVIATDGGWVRNFPLEHAYLNPDVASIVAFRYVASYRPTNVAFLARLRERLDRFRAVPPARALLEELRLAEARAARGEPAHYGELIVRLMRVTIARNTVLEERLADERETSVAELLRLRAEVVEIAAAAAPPWRRRRVRAELEHAFSSARFPFRHDRHVPTLVVRGSPGERALDPTFRSDAPWSTEDKRALVERGYRLTEEVLAAAADPSG